MTEVRWEKTEAMRHFCREDIMKYSSGSLRSKIKLLSSGKALCRATCNSKEQSICLKMMKDRISNLSKAKEQHPAILTVNNIYRVEDGSGRIQIEFGMIYPSEASTALVLGIGWHSASEILVRTDSTTAEEWIVGVKVYPHVWHEFLVSGLKDDDESTRLEILKQFEEAVSASVGTPKQCICGHLGW
jgi:hypothetical protein